MSTDRRFTWGLIIDVLNVLERHGYHRHDDERTGHAIGVIDNLARTYEGSPGTGYRTRPDRFQAPSDLAPGQQAPGAAQDVVVVPFAEVPAVMTALDLAADTARAQAGTCTGCTDRSCAACRTCLQDAQAYDLIAVRMLNAGRAPDHAGPEPYRQSTASQADQVADREAGQ